MNVGQQETHGSDSVESLDSMQKIDVVTPSPELVKEGRKGNQRLLYCSSQTPDDVSGPLL